MVVKFHLKNMETQPKLLAVVVFPIFSSRAIFGGKRLFNN